MRMVKAQDYFETYISQGTMVESCFNEVVIFSNTIETISKSHVLYMSTDYGHPMNA